MGEFRMRIPEAIRTERLTIRPFRPEDLPAYLEFMTDPRATEYLMLTEEQKSPAGAEELFHAVRQSYETEEPIWALAIATEADGFVGSCGMSPIEGTIVECYYCLSPAHWMRGYATEATKALIRYLFTETDVTEIRAYMNPGNPNSAGVAQRVGMARHGLRTHPSFGNEGILYSITKDQ